jgi:hypothetical protein
VIKLKKRSPDDPLYKDIDRFDVAIKALFIAICKALYIDHFVEWLNNKLKRD